MKMLQITIIGGGSLGHVCAGVFSSQPNVAVSIFTGRPERWNNDIVVKDINGKIFEGHIAHISSNAEEVIPQSDIVFLCLPGFLIEKTLRDIKPYITASTTIGSIVSNTGFFFAAHDILPDGTKLFGFQRSPFIARVEEYGKSANLLGYKKEVAIACENIADEEAFRCEVERLFITPTKLLKNFYEVSLTNSNPILHTGRLYAMWGDWSGEVYDHNILFYKEWTDMASEYIMAMDDEFMMLLDKLPVEKGSIPRLLDYYESYDAASLTHKISNIAAFQTITSPMKEVEGGWIPDFESRYFTEDFPYGLRFIKELAQEYNIDTPTIDKVYNWGMERIAR